MNDAVTTVRKKKNKKDFILMAPYMMLKTGTWRYPFLMLDRIVDIKLDSKYRIVATRNVCSNEPQFQGHFTDMPVMPGVLIAEAFGQASEYLSFLIDFVEKYKSVHGVDLSKDRDQLRDILHSEKGLGVVDELRASTYGFLASQDIKYRDAVGPGDVLEVISERIVFDNGFSHFNVEARVKNKVVSSGRISNWRKIRDSDNDEAIEVDKVLSAEPS